MEIISFKYLKNLAIYSAILGAGCAIISLIPFLMPIVSLFFLPFLGAIAPMVLLIKLDNFNSDENKTFAILGSLSGFFICLSYCVVFVPLVFLIHLIFKSYYDYGVQYLNLFLSILFFIMIAIVYVLTNAVLGLIFGIIFNYIKQNKQNVWFFLPKNEKIKLWGKLS